MRLRAVSESEVRSAAVICAFVVQEAECARGANTLAARMATVLVHAGANLLNGIFL